MVDFEHTEKGLRMATNEMIRNGRFYRFTILHGLVDVSLEEYQAINSIATYTDEYLSDP